MDAKLRPAPTFSLPDDKGEQVSLADYKGKWLILYFYPKDDTPGCTMEACSFRDYRDDIKEQTGASIVGVSKDDLGNHQSFKERYNLNFSLLTDKSGETIKAYGAWGTKMYGREGILRKTFIIDPDGNITKEYPRVTPLNHAERVLDDLKGLMKK